MSRVPRTCSRLVGRMAMAVALVTAVVSAQQPTFRTGVELVLADVQVVDKNGYPVRDLAPEQFQVSIDGKSQRVMSAEYVDSTRPGNGLTPVGANVAASSASRPQEGRLIILAVDTLSFPAGVSAGVMAAARDFLKRLQPSDEVGLFAYPQGVRVSPTTDHGAVSRALLKVSGSRSFTPGSQFRLRPSELVDLSLGFRTGTVESWTEAPVVRECGAIRDGNGQEITNPARRNFNCEERLRLEVISSVTLLETVASHAVGGLREVLQSLEALPGRKTVVIVTAGMLASDRPGGRPDIEDLSMLAGQDAARANATVYSVFVDSKYLQRNAPETRKADLNGFTTLSRDSDTMARWFERFSGMAGGTVITDLLGRGEIGFDRILRETAGYYRLGIDASTVERNGEAQRIAVKVNQKGATVRGRPWVIVPKARP